MRLGVLDIGSNTAHLLVVDAHYGAAPVPAVSHKTELRLAERMAKDGTVRGAAIHDLVDFARESLLLAEDMGVTEVTAFATSAIREAGNGDEVLSAVSEAAGIDIDVLSGQEEARLTFLAVRRWFGWSAGRLLVLDIGGGSLEIATGLDEDPDAAVSLPLGAGRLTQEWLDGDPPSADQVRALRRHVRAEVASTVGGIRRFGPPGMAVGTSKSFRQLARIAGAPASSEGPYVRRELSAADLRAWVPKLAEMPERERAELPGVSEGRAGQLVAAAVVAEAAMDLFDVSSLEICPWALREGVILRRLDQIEP